MDKLDLSEYYDLFDGALKERYDDIFEAGFMAIEDRFQGVRKGLPKGRALTVDDVMAIFDSSLPYVRDWTKPDKADLDERMNKFATLSVIQDRALHQLHRFLGGVVELFFL